MIEADQTTEAPPSAADKEDAAPIPAHPANPAPPEGQDCAVEVSLILCLKRVKG